jgi:hypothetical protein
MRIHDLREERADIAGWSAPLIADCLGLAYRACLGNDEQLIRPIATQHRKVWCSLVNGDASTAAQARDLLLTLARICRLTPKALDAIDDLVLDELTEVVSMRYQGSPRMAHCYNRLLIESATALTKARLNAA